MWSLEYTTPSNERIYVRRSLFGGFEIIEVLSQSRMDILHLKGNKAMVLDFIKESEIGLYKNLAIRTFQEQDSISNSFLAMAVYFWITRHLHPSKYGYATSELNVVPYNPSLLTQLGVTE